MVMVMATAPRLQPAPNGGHFRPLTSALRAAASDLPANTAHNSAAAAGSSAASVAPATAASGAQLVHGASSTSDADPQAGATLADDDDAGAAQFHERPLPDAMQSTPSKCARICTSPDPELTVTDTQRNQPAADLQEQQQQQQQVVNAPVEHKWHQAQQRMGSIAADHMPLTWIYDAVHSVWQSAPPEGLGKDSSRRVLSYSASIKQQLDILQQHGMFSRQETKTKRVNSSKIQITWKTNVEVSELAAGVLSGGDQLTMKDLPDNMDGGLKALPDKVDLFESSYNRSRVVKVHTFFIHYPSEGHQQQKAGGVDIGGVNYSELKQLQKPVPEFRSAVHELEMCCCHTMSKLEASEVGAVS